MIWNINCDFKNILVTLCHPLQFSLVQIVNVNMLSDAWGKRSRSQKKHEFHILTQMGRKISQWTNLKIFIRKYSSKKTKPYFFNNFCSYLDIEFMCVEFLKIDLFVAKMPKFIKTPKVTKRYLRIIISNFVSKFIIQMNLSHSYRKVASTNASRFVTRLVFKHT